MLLPLPLLICQLNDDMVTPNAAAAAAADPLCWHTKCAKLTPGCCATAAAAAQPIASASHSLAQHHHAVELARLRVVEAAELLHLLTAAHRLKLHRQTNTAQSTQRTCQLSATCHTRPQLSCHTSFGCACHPSPPACMPAITGAAAVSACTH
jgi:hypothetical protein